MYTSIPARIESIAKCRPDHTAVIHEHRRVSYADLQRALVQTAGGLQRSGLCEGDWVALTVGGQFRHLVLALALLRLGCHQVCLPSHEGKDSNLRLAARIPLRWHIVEDPALLLDGPRGIVWSPGWSAGGLPDPQVAECAGAHDALIVFTSSGTTGNPKLIPFTQSHYVERFPPDSAVEAVFHQRISIEHNIGKAGFLRTVSLGQTIVTSDNGETADVFELCRRYNVTSMRTSAFIARKLVAAAKASAMRDAMAGVEVSLTGSQIPIDLVEEIRSWLTQSVRIIYGTMEAVYASVARYEDLLKNPVSVGFPVAGVAVRIVDEKYAPLPAGQQGRIGVKSAMCARGYLFDDELTAKHFRDGWFYPGDIGRFDADGMLLFDGRADDMMIMNSINIFPAEIEAVAVAYPGIEDCAAFPIASAAHGAIPALAVAAGIRLDTEALAAFCRQSLGIRAPRRVIQVSEIPRNAQGKVLRRKLSELARATT
jgi:acyl-coenzyme A synthetase/AMP-(fatty) acid ligase